MSAPDEDLIRLAIRTKGDIIRLKEACRIVYAANSLLRSLDIRGEEGEVIFIFFFFWEELWKLSEKENK